MPRMTGCNPAAPAGTGTCTRVPVSSSQCTPTHLRHHSKHAHHRAESLRCSTVRRPPRRVVGRPRGGHRITTALDKSTTLAPLRHHITNRTSPGHPTGGSLHVATSPDRMVSTRTTTSPLPPCRRIARLRSSHHDTMLPGHVPQSASSPRGTTLTLIHLRPIAPTVAPRCHGTQTWCSAASPQRVTLFALLQFTYRCAM